LGRIARSRACLSLFHLRKLPDRNAARSEQDEDLSKHTEQIRSILYDLVVPNKYPTDDKTAWVTSFANG
jgi:hypothetical protein